MDLGEVLELAIRSRSAGWSFLFCSMLWELLLLLWFLLAAELIPWRKSERGGHSLQEWLAF